MINHKVPGTLYRGQDREGWFVGVIQQPLPLLKETLTGKLIFSDVLQRTASADVSLMADPTILKKPVHKRRGGLFEPHEMDLEKAVLKGPSA